MIFKNKSSYDWLVVGLGNPGLQYENTRHNAGFIVADELAKSYNFEFNKTKFDSVIGEFKIKDKRILIIKPQTYMNNSGRAVQKVSAFYKIPTDRIIVMHDDISLDVGTIRMRRKGSDGGQKGMRDIIELLGREDIMRIKIGVGKKPHPEYDLVNWVLGKFPDEQKEQLETAIKNTAAAVNEIIINGLDSAMNKYSH